MAMYLSQGCCINATHYDAKSQSFQLSGEEALLGRKAD